MTNKLKSRKFWVWLVWTMMTFGAIGLTATGTELDLNPILQWYGPVSLLWIGSEAAIDAIKKDRQ